MATLKDVAQHAGVSTCTASLVLNGKAQVKGITEQTSRAVIHAAAELRYRPRASARSMRSHVTKNAGVIIRSDPDFPYENQDSYFTIIGVNEGLQSAGYVLSIIRISDVKAGLHSASRVMREQVLDGVLLLSHLPAEIERRVEELFPKTVFVDTNVWRDERCIRRDERHAGDTLAQRAIDAGYRRLIWVGFPPGKGDNDTDHFSHHDRVAAARGAAAESGVGWAERFTLRRATDDFDRAIQPLLGPDTAVLASTFHDARLVARAAAKAGRRQGLHFGLACCDLMPALMSDMPELAGVNYDRFHVGRQAASLFLNVLAQRDPDADLAKGTAPGGAAANGAPTDDQHDADPGTSSVMVRGDWHAGASLPHADTLREPNA